MKTFVHTFTYRLKQISIITVLVLCCCFVYAGGNNNGGGNAQAKVVRFYPNPATSFVNFEFSSNIDKNYSIQVYSFSGRKMVELPVSSSKISVTLSNDFYRGIYVFQLRDKAGRIVESGKFQVVK